MNPDRWLQIERIFDAALSLPIEERAAYQSAACKGDNELEHEVAELLETDNDSEIFLSRLARNIEYPELLTETLRETAGTLSHYQISGRQSRL